MIVEDTAVDVKEKIAYRRVMEALKAWRVTTGRDLDMPETLRVNPSTYFSWLVYLPPHLWHHSQQGQFLLGMLVVRDGNVPSGELRLE